MNEKDNTLTIEDYKSALASQTACNARGLIRALTEVLSKIESVNHGLSIDWISHHPIIQLYVYQIAWLSHGIENMDWTGYGQASLFCCLVAEGRVLPDSDYTQANFQV